MLDLKKLGDEMTEEEKAEATAKLEAYLADMSAAEEEEIAAREAKQQASMDLAQQAAKELMPEPLTETQRVYKPPEPAKLRAFRANMFRRLNKKFLLYVPFTPETAAYITSQEVKLVYQYLVYEAALAGSRITALPDGTFCINSPFD